jgi:putative tryptophan/tyrosine transport system substrate-binding protein
MIGRREFITLLGGAGAAWPLAAHGQQATPVIGYLGISSPEPFASRLQAFRHGLSETGYAEGRNVKIDYRWAENQFDRLGALASDLVNQRPSTIVAAGSIAGALAVKAATTTIPIVFETGADPVASGLVPSLSRPGGNITGVTSLNIEVSPKRLELLRELIPNARVVALLVNPASTSITQQLLPQMQTAAQSLGLELHILEASGVSELESAFARLAQLGADGLIVSSEPFFNSRNAQLGTLGLRYGIPTISQSREFADAGGLASYGGSVTESHRLTGHYAGRVLKGENPANLPVQQSTKVELIINLKTAKTLGITVPLPLSGRADELIE